MSASDARPVPRKNAAWRVYFAIRKNDGTLITTWAGQDSEVSLDGAAFADCTNEATEVGTSGCGYLDLTSSEMNADSIVLKITVTNTDALPIVLTVFPEEAGDYRVADTQKVDVETIKTQAVTCVSGVTVPSVIASTTNITAGTITTVTNLTNAPTNGDLTATMKASVTTAVPTKEQISTQVASDLATAHGAGSWATATGFSTHSAADVWAVGTRTITGGSLTTSPPTAAVIADAVWDEARSGHVAAGTFGEKVNAELDSATQAQIDNVENASGYLLAVLAGACADPQTASETYAITVFGSTFTVDMAGQTSTGTRTAPTLTKT